MVRNITFVASCEFNGLVSRAAVVLQWLFFILLRRALLILMLHRPALLHAPVFCVNIKQAVVLAHY
jgi:hypothetical protein